MESPFERELLRGSLDLMVLSILAGEAKYGYLIQKDLRTASKDKLKLGAGTLYPLLHRLEGDGLIRSRWDSEGGRRRKWYEITAAGKRRLGAQALQWDAFAACMGHLLADAIPSRPKPAV